MGPYFFLLTDMGPPRKMGPQPGISDITTHITCVQTVATPNKALFVGSYFPHQIPRRALCLVHATQPETLDGTPRPAAYLSRGRDPAVCGPSRMEKTWRVAPCFFLGALDDTPRLPGRRPAGPEARLRQEL